MTPYQFEDLSRTIPTDRKKKEEGKTEDKREASSLGQSKSIGPAL